jgi:hypothetical protein
VRPHAGRGVFVYVYSGKRVPHTDSCKELVPIPTPILEGISAQVAAVTKGLGADLVFPALLRKLDRTDASYKN